ncbi:MAG: glycosyltransferase family 4 protein [Candidatus Sumerlaeaceae bacterium]
MATLAREQAIGLSQLGHTVHVEALACVPGEEESPQPNIEIHRKRVGARAILRLLPLTLQLSKTIRGFKPDVVWTPTYRGYGLPVYLCCSAARIPYGIYFHGTEIQTELRSSIRRTILARLIDSAALVVANSRNTANLLAKHFPGTEAEVLSPGVDPGKFSSPEARKLAVHLRENWLISRPDGAQPTVLLSVCRLTKGKGIHLVLQALEEVLAARPELHWIYVIAGGGPDAKEFETLATSLGLSGRVIFTGPVAHEVVPSYFCAADVYVQPSQPEGDFLESFGISFLEAQAAGLPCIGSDWGGVPEAVENGRSALLVPVGNVAAIREAIVRLVAYPQARAGFSNHASTVAGQHTWAQHVDGLSERLSRLVKARHAS